MSRTTLVLLLATGGWSAFWTSVAVREHSWWTVAVFGAAGCIAFGTILALDRRARKERP